MVCRSGYSECMVWSFGGYGRKVRARDNLTQTSLRTNYSRSQSLVRLRGISRDFTHRNFPAHGIEKHETRIDEGLKLFSRALLKIMNVLKWQLETTRIQTYFPANTLSVMSFQRV